MPYEPPVGGKYAFHSCRANHVGNNAHSTLCHLNHGWESITNPRFCRNRCTHELLERNDLNDIKIRIIIYNVYHLYNSARVLISRPMNPDRHPALINPRIIILHHPARAMVMLFTQDTTSNTPRSVSPHLVPSLTPQSLTTSSPCRDSAHAVPPTTNEKL